MPSNQEQSFFQKSYRLIFFIISQKIRNISKSFYCCTVHFDDSTIFTHQHMHLYHILLNRL
jgi:hypothetical protein